VASGRANVRSFEFPEGKKDRAFRVAEEMSDCCSSVGVVFRTTRTHSYNGLNLVSEGDLVRRTLQIRSLALWKMSQVLKKF
jgi:hypothetical protein